MARRRASLELHDVVQEAAPAAVKGKLALKKRAVEKTNAAMEVTDNSANEARDLLIATLGAERAKNPPRGALESLFKRVRPTLMRSMGPDAWEAMIVRAQADVSPDTRSQADRDDEVVASIATLLTHLIGGVLALRLLHQACETSAPGLDKGTHHD